VGKEGKAFEAKIFCCCLSFFGRSVGGFSKLLRTFGMFWYTMDGLKKRTNVSFFLLWSRVGNLFFLLSESDFLN
jgi:hypothetical protein